MFFGFHFISRFSESSVAVCCLISSPSGLVCSQGMPAGVTGQNRAMSEEERSEGNGLEDPQKKCVG